MGARRLLLLCKLTYKYVLTQLVRCHIRSVNLIDVHIFQQPSRISEKELNCTPIFLK